MADPEQVFFEYDERSANPGSATVDLHQVVRSDDPKSSVLLDEIEDACPPEIALAAGAVQNLGWMSVGFYVEASAEGLDSRLVLAQPVCDVRDEADAIFTGAGKDISDLPHIILKLDEDNKRELCLMADHCTDDYWDVPNPEQKVDIDLVTERDWDVITLFRDALHREATATIAAHNPQQPAAIEAPAVIDSIGFDPEDSEMRNLMQEAEADGRQVREEGRRRGF